MSHLAVDCDHVEALNEEDLDAFTNSDVDGDVFCQSSGECADGMDDQPTWVCLSCKVAQLKLLKGLCLAARRACYNLRLGKDVP